jgi:hypothetical protein
LGVNVLQFTTTTAVTIGYTSAASIGGGLSMSIGAQTGASGQTGGTTVVYAGAGGSGGSSGNIEFCLAGNNSSDFVSLAGGSSSSARGAMTWSSLITPLLTQATATSDVATIPFTITSQAPYTSASTHLTAGNIVLSIPGSKSGTPQGYVEFVYGGTVQSAIGIDPTNGGNQTDLWLGLAGAAPTGTNYALTQSGGLTLVNAATSVGLSIGTVSILYGNSTSLQAVQPLSGFITSPAPLAFASSGNTALSTTGGTYTLATTGGNLYSPVLSFTGTLAQNLTVVLPNSPGVYLVNTSGLTPAGFTIAFKSGTGTTAAMSLGSLSGSLIIVVTNPSGTNTISACKTS